MTSDPAGVVDALEAAATVTRVGPPGRGTTWRRFGEGPPLVLLHGGHGSWLHWVRNIEALAAGHTLWLADLPGYGDSDAPVPSSLEGLLLNLKEGLDEVIGPSGRFGLAGFSFGGLVAAHVAARRAGVVALALLGPAGHGTARRPRAELRSWRDLPAKPDAPALLDVMRHNLSAHMLHDEAAIDDVALRLHTAACLRTRFRSKPISRAGGLKTCLEAYAGPLLLLWGEHDVTTTPEQAQALLGQGRLQSRSAILSGAGHWVQYEASDAVNALLRVHFAASRGA